MAGSERKAGTIIRGALVAFALAAATALVLPIGADSAKRPLTGKIRTGTATVQIPGVQGAIGHVVAHCPRGRAVSGGFSTSPVPNELAAIESRRSGRTAWSASVQQFTNNAAPAELTVYVYCDRRLQYPTVSSDQATIPVGTTDTATATCPIGKRAIAGGFSIDTDSMFSGAGGVLASLRSQRGAWSITADGINPPSTELTAYAYCIRRSGKLRQREGTATLGGTTTTATSGRCPKRVTARSGGFAIEPPSSEDNLTLFESRRAGRRWRFSMRNLGVPASPMKALAYCS